MQYKDITSLVERQFIQGATVEELRIVVDDLRALSRRSLLADFVEGRLLTIEAVPRNPMATANLPRRTSVAMIAWEQRAGRPMPIPNCTEEARFMT